MDDVTSSSGVAPMFTPFTLRGMTLHNRIVMSPMCMYSADDGTVNDFHVVHLGSRAMGGTALVITELTDVSPEGRISYSCAGMYKPDHMPAWKRVVDYVHDWTDASIGIQLGHAGRKASNRRTPDGRNEILDEEAGWPILGPSPLAFGPGCQVPKEMDEGDIDKVRRDFARAAEWSVEAGFDMIELHFAHGYLMSTFISPLSNQRTDKYGGSLENRMRLPLEVFHIVRDILPDEKPMSARISATDWLDGGITGDDAVEIGHMLKAAGLDIVDVSTGNVISGARPKPEGLFQTPYSDRVRNEAGIPTMTVGNIRGVDDINQILTQGWADLCVLGKGHLFDPYFTRHAARALDHGGLKWPMQYAAAGAFQPQLG